MSRKILDKMYCTSHVEIQAERTISIHIDIRTSLELLNNFWKCYLNMPIQPCTSWKYSQHSKDTAHQYQITRSLLLDAPYSNQDTQKVPTPRMSRKILNKIEESCWNTSVQTTHVDGHTSVQRLDNFWNWDLNIPNQPCTAWKYSHHCKKIQHMNANNDIAAIGSCPYSNQEYTKTVPIPSVSRKKKVNRIARVMLRYRIKADELHTSRYAFQFRPT